MKLLILFAVIVLAAVVVFWLVELAANPALHDEGLKLV
jgi:hypothetical protein